MRRTLLSSVAAVLVLALVGLGVGAAQTPADARSWLAGALDRTEELTARLELNAVSEMRGSDALGGGFSQSIHGVGELVPPERLHLFIDGASPVQELVIVGTRMWVDAGDGLRLASKVPLGPLSEPRAPLDFIRGPGQPEFSGFGLTRGALTYRLRMELDGFELQARLRSDQPVDPDTVGLLEVEIGVFDGLIRRQTLQVSEPADRFSGTGLTAVRTTYTIEYWDQGGRLEVPEPK